MKKGIAVLLILLLITGTAQGDSVTKMHYVYSNWVGEYTGQVDTNNIPFGFGLFESETEDEGEIWHYIGSWESGMPEGEGAVYYDNGSMKKGSFHLGEMVEGILYSVSGLAVLPVKVERIATDTEVAYVGNKKSMRFHLPTCRAVNQMKEANKVELFSREEAIERHFTPCGECNP